jgi:hypothetical protein
MRFATKTKLIGRQLAGNIRSGRRRRQLLRLSGRYTGQIAEPRIPSTHLVAALRVPWSAKLPSSTLILPGLPQSAGPSCYLTEYRTTAGAGSIPPAGAKTDGGCDDVVSVPLPLIVYCATGNFQHASSRGDIASALPDCLFNDVHLCFMEQG